MKHILIEMVTNSTVLGASLCRKWFFMTDCGVNSFTYAAKLSLRVIDSLQGPEHHEGGLPDAQVQGDP